MSNRTLREKWTTTSCIIWSTKTSWLTICLPLFSSPLKKVKEVGTKDLPSSSAPTIKGLSKKIWKWWKQRINLLGLCSWRELTLLDRKWVSSIPRLTLFTIHNFRTFTSPIEISWRLWKRLLNFTLRRTLIAITLIEAVATSTTLVQMWSHLMKNTILSWVLETLSRAELTP